MLIVADTHVHIYPLFDTAVALKTLADRLERYSGGVDHVKVACLAERADCSWFKETAAGDKPLPKGYELESVQLDDPSLTIRDAEGRRLYIIAGRQYAASERIEVVALGTDDRIEEVLTAAEFVKRISEGQGIPVLSWSFGKWLFKRGKIAQDVVRNAVERLVVGDISQRPAGFPEPAAFRLAREKNLPIIAGTDPLPRAGEEQILGSYCTVIDGEFDEGCPAASMRSLLSGAGEIKIAGQRSGLICALTRVGLYTLSSAS